ncbi:hypothetical protein GCM10017674_67130 [Streptomyces gardneri]|uniref:Uncharacterized protein n=1 Tax=Streptomyces gardneri TaxID=66892 RepID=A0A4Y3RK15_9ACTN|nr:hypothetical protein SGA01_26480 [Streptomyces gardneri]GHH16795.1 hypothetical protein GCM10017674_67130 [Streptomyces gardneri]
MWSAVSRGPAAAPRLGADCDPRTESFGTESFAAEPSAPLEHADKATGSMSPAARAPNVARREAELSVEVVDAIDVIPYRSIGIRAG